MVQSRNQRLTIIFTVGLLIVVVVIVAIYMSGRKVFENALGRCSYEGTTPFLDLRSTPLIAKLEASHRMIHTEVKGALQHFSPIKGDLFFREIADDKWKKIYLKWYGESPAYAYGLFPKTMELVDSHPEIRLAMFSMLEPGAVIKQHRGPYRGCIRVHLGIMTPNSPKCFISVGGTQYHWKDGEAVAFDDTYVHFVRNDTNKTRVILFLDVERRYASKFIGGLNKLIMKHILPATGRSNEDLVRLHEMRRLGLSERR